FPCAPVSPFCRQHLELASHVRLCYGEPMEHELEDTIALLERTPATLNALLRDLPEVWTYRNEGGDSFDAYNVVGHLIHCEYDDWMQRVMMVLEHGENETFRPFDRRGHEQAVKGKSLSELLDEFARLRGENLHKLRSLQLKPQDLERCGRHPVFGAVKLSAL